MIIKLDPVVTLSDEQFFELCQRNRELKFERNAQGDLLIMEPTGGETGNLNFALTTQLGIWDHQAQLGKGFDSSTGFKLPNGADRSPDLAWIPIDKWNALTPEQRRRFLPLCPDFVVELRSASDSLSDIQVKMREYIDNGCRLGWLLDAKNKRVEIYRPEQAPEILEDPDSLSGEEVLPGFILDLRRIWG
ncbi:MAG: Uma2 family endonuclease [Cyanobacteriota bacterium]|nr:Uma2 family endonuclease [Cyanobacteriota bacterium]